MSFNIVEQIRRRTREGWIKWLQQGVIDARIWVQEHGELSLVFGIVAGIVLAIQFHSVLIVLLLLIVAAFVVWGVALPEVESEVGNKSGCADGTCGCSCASQPESKGPIDSKGSENA